MMKAGLCNGLALLTCVPAFAWGANPTCGDLAKLRLEIADSAPNEGAKAFNLAVTELQMMARHSVCGSRIYETSDAFIVRYNDGGSVKEDLFNRLQGRVVSWARTRSNDHSSFTNFTETDY